MSRRTTKPGLFATLDTAAEQAGIEVDADLLYATSKWAIEQGRRWPWFRVNESRILAEQGGLDAAILCVAGMALGRANQAGITHGDDMRVPVREAADEYRSMLKRQWDTTESSLRGTHVPFTDLPPDIVPEHLIEEERGHNAELNPLAFEDPRLQALWPKLTNRQRQFLTHLADTGNQTQAGELMGNSDRKTGNALMGRIRDRATTLEVE